MRYSITSKGSSLAQVETELRKIGATNIAKTKLLGHVFCDLTAEQAKALSLVSGLLVKLIKEYKTDQVERHQRLPSPGIDGDSYAIKRPIC